MEISRYQKLAARTLDSFGTSPNRTLQLCKAIIGLAGELGEVAEPLKKHLFHNKPLDIDAMEKELGDVQWYLCAIGTVLNIDMDKVLVANIEKIRTRHPECFRGDWVAEDDGEVP